MTNKKADPTSSERQRGQRAKAAHPSPFSAYRGFFGCNHFSKTNEILKKEGKQEINWSIE